MQRQQRPCPWPENHDGEHAHEGEVPASCEAFHDDCARLSETNAKAKECDEFVHVDGRTAQDCAAKKDECVVACK